MRAILIASLFLLLLPLPLASQEGGDNPADLLARAITMRQAGKLAAAQDLADRATTLAPENVAAWSERGRIAAMIAATPSGGGSFKATLYLKKAIGLGAKDVITHLLLARLLKASGRWEEVVEPARFAAAKAQERGDKKAAGQAHFYAGAAICSSLAKLPPEKKSDLNKLAGQALSHLQRATKLHPEQEEAWIYLSNTWAWLKNTANECKILRQGLDRFPQAEKLHSYYQNRLFALKFYDESIGYLTRLVEENPDNAIAHWFRGRAQLALAEEFRRLKQNNRARRAYGAAIATWQIAMNKKPGYAPTTKQCIAQAMVGIGWLNLQKNAVEESKSILFRAYDLCPAIFTKVDSLGTSYVQVLGNLGKNILSGGPRTAGQGGNSRAGRLRAAADFFQEIIAKHPTRTDHLGYWYNNVGLALRDLGSALGGRRGQSTDAPPAAKQAWLDSYQAYLKATRYFPDDPRILNDCALMQVFHLGTDIDLAEKMLCRARAKGLEMIAAEKENWTQDRMRFLEEAVGDAWANLAMILAQHRNKPEEAAAHRAEANKYYPRKQRAGRNRQNRRTTLPAFAKLAPEKRAGALKTLLARYERYLTMLKQRNMATQLTRMQERINKMKALAKAEKWAELDQLLQTR